MMGFCRVRPAGAAGAALGPALLLVLMVVGVLALPVSAPAGPPQWARSWDPRPGYDVFQVRIAAAPTADVYVATTPCSPAHQPCGIAVARYSDAGKRLWGTLLLKSMGSGLAAVASDPAGNLVVAGYAPAAAGGKDWWLAKVSPGGARVWSRRLAGVTGGVGEVAAVQTDAQGNIYACGRVVRSGIQTDAALAKWDARGRHLWTKYLSGGAGDDDQASALALDGRGRVYVTGHLREIATLDDVFVARYASNGHRDWLRTWNNRFADENDYALGIAASSSGAAVAGSTPGSWDSVYSVWDRDGLVLVFSPGGTLRWLYQEPGALPWGGFSAPYIDAAGNVAAAGSITAGSPADYKAMMIMLSPSGAVHYALWLPAGAARGSFNDLTRDGAALVAAGSMQSSVSASADVLLSSVTPGMQSWVRTYDSRGGRDDVGTDVLCGSGGMYVGGAFGNRLGLVRF